jgi:hypothetical protein
MRKAIEKGANAVLCLIRPAEGGKPATQIIDFTEELKEFEDNLDCQSLGLPPRRAGDHAMDLVPGREPPYKGLYKIWCLVMRWAGCYMHVAASPD